MTGRRLPGFRVLDQAAQLAEQETDDRRYPDMPEDGRAWRETLRYLDADCPARFSCGLARAAADDQRAVIRAELASLARPTRRLQERRGSLAVPSLHVTDGCVLATQGGASPALTITAVPAPGRRRYGRRRRSRRQLTDGRSWPS